ncbi:hypothetical protein UC34_03960 [Pandoraea vervacti]|uniref:DJ-1/PfpI domain-containing protein n=1 Tax=Pandoraea vervacti TaxID=656178 RepID=A0ABM5T3A4_9BURK|nr:DJ-1/PfpI family protein [Pandoraea vervacti]AJP59399.1 hypothetical protein UC34_03960 [Pandoraea vervacti]
MRFRSSLLAVLLGLCLVVPRMALATQDAATQARRELLDALASRPRQPVVAVIASNEGTETTDFLVPYAVLRRAGIAQVEAVAVESGEVTLMPALRIAPDTSLADFDARHPNGADIVIVPAMHVDDDARVLAWLRRQASQGALIVGICSGAKVLSHAGLLQRKRFTGHWYDRDDLRKANPEGRYVPDVRYLYDDGVVTTTGVSASLPVAITLVEGIAGTSRAMDVARMFGVTDASAHHVSAGFRLDASRRWTIARHWMAFWQHETFAIPVRDGVDDVSLALVSDAWSRTWRSQAVAVNAGAASERVTMASGLQLIAQTAQQSGASARTLPLSPDGNAMTRFTGALDAIEHRYGSATRDIVSLTMEYVDTSR